MLYYALIVLFERPLVKTCNRIITNYYVPLMLDIIINRWESDDLLKKYAENQISDARGVSAKGEIW